MRREQRDTSARRSPGAGRSIRCPRPVLGGGQRTAAGLLAQPERAARDRMKPSIRILHLEDDPTDAHLVREQLRRSGLNASISVVASQETFEAALADGGFDVVLCDYHLPRFDGLSALSLVRTRAGQIPFILVTGALGDERAVELLRSGATDFVLKDRLARLAPAIERALSEHSAAARHAAIEARLAQAQRLSKLAAEAARMGSWRLEVNTSQLECSDDFLSLLGIQGADWTGTIGALEALAHPDDRSQIRSLYVAHGDLDLFTEAQFRIRKPNGEMRWMYARSDRRMAGDDLPSPMVFGVMMDITERKRVDDRLRDTDRRKDEFLAMLAHELRNPLASISNGLALVRQSQARSSEDDDVHAMLDRQLKHTVRLVDDLIDVSRLTLGKIELERTSLELQTVVRNAVEMTRAGIEVA